MLQQIKDVEIFKTGRYNGLDITEDTLKELERNFNTMKGENTDFALPIKFGHQMKDLPKDGQPAAGWMNNVRYMSGKLIADFVDLPEAVFTLITNKAYKNRSIEFINNFVDKGGKAVGKMLKSIALLGSEMPAVNLADAAKYMYGATFAKDLESVSVEMSLEEPKEPEAKDKKDEPDPKTFKKEGQVPTALEAKEKELEAKEKKLERLLEKFSSVGSDPEKIVQLIEDAESKSEQLESQLKEFKKKEEAALQEDIKTFTDSLVKESRIIPAEVEKVKALLSSTSREKRLTFSLGHGVSKEESQFDLLKQFLQSLPDRGLFARNGSANQTSMTWDQVFEQTATTVFKYSAKDLESADKHAEVLKYTKAKYPEVYSSQPK